MLVIPERVALRAVSHVDLDPSGCHVSRYSVASHGYAQIGWHDGMGHREVTVAHRVVWQWVRGPIPDGMTVDHRCNNRRCVNIDHLRLLTNFDNARRTFGRDWPLGQCIHGHPDTELFVQGPRRRCRTCYDARNRVAA
jgi:hypothetical protein